MKMRWDERGRERNVKPEKPSRQDEKKKGGGQKRW
jgi:hypothetical protein